jgi:general stress protein 26
LYYLDKQGSGYVMIQGTAELITSPFEKEKHWKEGWQQFYPDRENNYILIKVRPRWLEVVSYTHGLLGDSITWQPPKVVLDHKDR